MILSWRWLTRRFELAQGRLEEAAAQLALAESHVQSAPPARRRRLAVAIASLRLALARRSGQFTEVMEQVKLLDASTADESSDQIAMGSELRGVALMNLGIVETWSGDSTTRSGTSPRAPRSRRRSADPIWRSRVAHIRVSRQRWSRSRPRASAAVRRSPWPSAMAWEIGRYSRPHLGRLVASRSGWASSTKAERWLRRAWEVAEPQIDPAAAVLLHASTGMLHAARGQHQSALQEFAAAVRAQSLLTGVHALGLRLPDGSRPRKLASGCQMRRARRSPDSPPRTD